MNLIIPTYTEHLLYTHRQAGGILTPPLAAATARTHHARADPDAIRQARPHAHMITTDPPTGAILVTDLGADAVLVYSLDETGRLTPKTTSRLDAAPGAGPRHLAFHPDGQHLFVVNELATTVRTLR